MTTTPTALPGSGQISLNQIHGEAGGASGVQCSINDADIRDMIGKGSGVSAGFNEYHGATKTILSGTAGLAGLGSYDIWYGSRHPQYGPPGYDDWAAYEGGFSDSRILTAYVSEDTYGYGYVGLRYASGYSGTFGASTITITDNANSSRTVSNGLYGNILHANDTIIALVSARAGAAATYTQFAGKNVTITLT